jgi:hypothetical protein
MHVLPMSLISAVVVLAASWPALCDDVPELNVDPVCRGAMRQKLSKEWGSFAPADRSHCIGSEKGGYASYTDLITCLEMARDASKMNN